jgi:tripartite-type tricarboxylate transporter receptor subunit TctC
MKNGRFIFALFLFLSFYTFPVGAQSDPFYKGKQIRIIVGLSSGGGYDRAARMLARHIVKHIPGNLKLSYKICRARARSWLPTMYGVAGTD